MYCIYVFTISSMKMFLRNRQALFFSLFVPFMILFIFGCMDFDKPPQMTIGLVTHSPNPATAMVLTQIRKAEALVIKEGTLDAELAELRKGNRTAVLDVPDNLVPLAFTLSPPPPLTLYPNESRPMEAGIFQTILEKAALSAAQARPLFTTQRKSVAVHNFRYIEFLLPGVVAMSIMQMSVFSVAFVFAQYREKGVLKRLLATPIRPYQFVTANIITRLTTSVAQAAILVATGMLVYKIPMAGSFWLLTLCVIMGALVFLGMGFTISGLSKSVETVPVLANLIVFPMMFLGGVFFPGTSMPAWLTPLADNLPLTFYSKALRAIMTDGANLAQIQGPMIGMLIWAVAMITLATLTFRIQERDST